MADKKEMTEEEKCRLVRSLFEDRPKDRRWEKFKRLDAQLSVNDGGHIPPSPEDQYLG